MKKEFFELPGDIISASQLKVSKARDLALTLEAGSVEYAQLVECKRISGNEEVVVFDVDVEVPQIRANPILPSERIAVTFEITDKAMPKTEALRGDFPRVPHLNLHLQEFPRNLCLYADRYEEVKRGWTPARFVGRIREWLALTVKGQLHQPDQPLEPVLLNYWGHIVLPHDLCSIGKAPDRLFITKQPFGTTDKPFLLAQRVIPSEGMQPFVVSVHRSVPHVHGIISQCPATLAHLADMVAPTGLALLEDIRERFKQWHSESQSHQDFHVLIVILFPRTRTEGGTEERVDVWTFWLDGTLRTLGVRLGIWQVQDGKLGLFLTPDCSKRGEDVGVAVLNTSFELTGSVASAINGQPDRTKLRIAAVGLGALGSHAVINLARSGFGSWSLIDHDLIMPHNLARHALYGPFVGCPKADGIAFVANTIVADSKPFSSFRVDVLSPGAQEESLVEALQNADVILDMSASVGVARALSGNFKSGARRISLFLTPAGDDLVLLSEESNRATTLDSIEMQYYRAVLFDERLQGHLQPPGGQQRYGQSCRDITHTLPHNLVALHAAIGAAALQEIVDQPHASITIWRCDSARNVLRVDVPPVPMIRHMIGAWTVITDEGLLRRLRELRDDRLPNETGGVLLGSFDMERHLIYIVDSIPSPSDSEEWPTLYVRGCQGLQQAVDQSVERTNGMIEYVGEWHSHPCGASTAPSIEDLQVFSWLTELMNRDGLPAVMNIVGDSGRLSCFVGEIEKKENLLSGGVPSG